MPHLKGQQLLFEHMIKIREIHSQGKVTKESPSDYINIYLKDDDR